MPTKTVIEWLSSPENPPVHYLTARNLNPKKISKNEMNSLRTDMLKWKPLKKILALQEKNGSFSSYKNEPPAYATFIALSLMERCGMDTGDGPVSKALAYLTEHHIGNGALSINTGGSGIIPCYLGLATKSIIKMGGFGEPSVEESIRWLCDHQRFDHKKTRAGGKKKWPFKSVVNYGCWSSVSCYHGVVGAFAVLSAISPEHRSKTVNERIQASLEYLRIHRVYLKSKVEKPIFRHTTEFFLNGNYRQNLIDVLDGIADADKRLIGDEWIRNAVDTVDNLTNDGKVALVKNYPTGLIDPLPFEETGKPSRFLTYQWLIVKKKFGLMESN
jgi:hypothetical protein